MFANEAGNVWRAAVVVAWDERKTRNGRNVGVNLKRFGEIWAEMVSGGKW